MKDIFELIKEKNSLPKGNIYKKKIKGKIYYYHQYNENGKRYSKKISDSRSIILSEQIKQRKDLEKQIKILLKSQNRNLSLSNSSKSLTGYLLSKNKIVATFDRGQLSSYDEKLCPLIIKRTHKLESFLKYRVIDSNRLNAKLIKKLFNMSSYSDNYISLANYAASISDTYWFKSKTSKLKYREVAFKSDIYSDITLKGLLYLHSSKFAPNPELTTVGRYEKGWKLIDGEWYLYKSESREEMFSEIFYGTLFELLGLDSVHYEISNGYIRSKNFSKEYNFEPMSSLCDDNDSIEYVCDTLSKLDEKLLQAYLRLCFYDVVLNNTERDNSNCGLLRDRKTGQIISLAPNFDNNACLISRDNYLDISSKESFLKMFVSFLRRNPKYKEILKNINLPVINDDILDKCFEKIDIKIDNKEMIKNFILNRFIYLINYINK